MTAAALYWPNSGRLEAYGAFPARPGLDIRGRQNNVGDRYVEMEKRGELWTFPGLVTPVAPFLRRLAKKVEGFEILEIVADQFRAILVKQALEESSLDWKIDFRHIGQGQDGSTDIESFRLEVLRGHVKLTPSLLLESAIQEAKVVRDHNGNPALDKSRQRGQIDPIQAVVHATGAGRRYRHPVEEKNPVWSAMDYILR